MFMTILRKLAGVNRLKDFNATGVSSTSINRLWKEKVDIGWTAFSTPTKRYRLSRCLLVDDFHHGGFIAALNHKRQYLIIILMNLQ